MGDYRQRFSHEYLAHLHSTRWQWKRWLVCWRDLWRCQLCGIMKRRLDVHHLSYTYFRHEPLGDLLSVCRRCHDAIHGNGSQRPSWQAWTWNIIRVLFWGVVAWVAMIAVA